MKTVILFDPSIGSQNVGDSIISESIRKIAYANFQNYLICVLPTQMPVSSKIAKRYQDADIKLVMGSNLLQSHMIFSFGRRGLYTHAIRQWDTSVLSKRIVSRSILWGCGWQNYDERIDRLTEKYWHSILDDQYIHSVRDDFTLRMLNKIGIYNVVNTGCPTTWGLSPEHCALIPSQKADKVITTITDYRPDKQRDTLLLKALLDNYDKVYLWLQGQGDELYFNSFNDEIKENITLIQPNLVAYSNMLDSGSIDYVGTRLHGGIFAMQHKVRSIIIGIDNRALEMKNTGLCVLPAIEMEDLNNLLQSKIYYNISLPDENIQRFITQFFEE